MAGRVLNFSEFFDKYSKDGATTEKGLDAITQSSSNFEAGFDDETYDQEQLGPNRPVSGGIDATLPQPGEEGAQKMSVNFDPEMAPQDVEKETDEVEEEDEETEEVEEEDEETEEVEEEDEETEEVEEEDEEVEEETEEEEAEEGNPESQKGPNESFQHIYGFSKFILESYGRNRFEEEPTFDEEDERFSEANPDTCPNCGEVYEIGANPGEVSCGCNM